MTMQRVRRIEKHLGMQDRQYESYGFGVNGEEMTHGALYQLDSHPGLKPGDCVCIDGPYDTYGVIMCAQWPSKLSERLVAGEPMKEMICYSRGDSGKPDLKTMINYSIRGTGRGKKSDMAYTTVSK